MRVIKAVFQYFLILKKIVIIPGLKIFFYVKNKGKSISYSKYNTVVDM